MTPSNPFILTGYVSPEYFCDRESETKKLISALRNGRNITLISPRRMGKTGLIRHAFFYLSKQPDTMCYYVDLYQTHDLASLVKKLGETVLGTLDSREEKIVRKVSSFFKSLRPVVSVDPMTGEPSFTIDIRPELAELSLQEIFAYIEQSGKHGYISFDEFQTVAGYEDKNVEALLRAHIQHLTSVNFIFSGSERHVLENMFVSASRPFYQSTQLMNLGRIDATAYFLFAQDKLKLHNQSISEESFKYIYDKFFGHTWYIQMMLNRLYETNAQNITIKSVDEMTEEIINENEVTYQTFLRLITPGQAKLLKAIARGGSVQEIQSHNFLQSNHLGASSTVKSAAKVLVEKELLLLDIDKYQIYDRFFMYWLRMQ